MKYELTIGFYFVTLRNEPQIGNKMKKIILGLMLLALTADTGQLYAQDAEWELVFSDEFNQPNGSQPDSAKWNRHERYKGTWSRWISNSPSVVYIKNDCLVCKAIPNKVERTDTAQMLTGAINTKGKFEFQYGKVEVRMKTNRKQGNFPAAWLAKNNHFDQYGEIDIVEMFGRNTWASHAIHSKLTFTNSKHGQKNHFLPAPDIQGCTKPDWYEAPHVRLSAEQHCRFLYTGMKSE